MQNLPKFYESCNEIAAKMQELISLFEKMKQQFPAEQLIPAPKIALNNSIVPEVTAPVIDSNLDQFEALKKALFTNRWPDTINPYLICDPESDKDKHERGRGVIELMIENDLKAKKFLDFGCGEGHCAAVSAEKDTALSVGYDINPYANWNQFTKSNLLFSDNLDVVKNNGPYDVIVLFDVIDHLESGDPISVLNTVRELLADDGSIYMRTHPFTSRHATHLYHDINKAYVHLVFTPEELKLLVPESKYQVKNSGVTKPIITYENYIKSAGLKIKTRRDIKEEPEQFFKIPKIAERIIKHTKHNSYPEYQLSLQFIDFCLTK